MRLIGLNDVALRYDETFTAWIARLPTLDRVLGAARSDVHPPSWYVVEWATVKLLGSSAALRPTPIHGDPRLALTSVYQEFKAGDVLYYSSMAPAISNGYFLPDKPFQVRPDSDDLILALSADSKQAMGFPFATLGSGDYRRAWLIFVRGNGTTQAEISFLDEVLPYGVPKLIQTNSYGLSSEIWLIDLDAYRAKTHQSN